MLFDGAISTERKAVRLTACLIIPIVKAQRYKADVMSDLNLSLPYYPLDLAAKKINCTEMELLILAQEGTIQFHKYPDPTLGILEWDSVTSVDIGVIILRNKNISENIKSIISECTSVPKGDPNLELTDLVIPREELIKAYNILNNTSVEIPARKITYETAKQSDFIVSLLRSHGLTDDDFKGSIGALRTKISKKSDIPPNLDNNSLKSWLVKANVRPE
ncbi:hypothetical protein [Xenorhabdus sp. PB61.4]|uniref:hypothetical protein n=2 Tax=Xenorhabdus sp. PB61.4 TaxID=2788940 RepID=UPI0030DA67A7